MGFGEETPSKEEAYSLKEAKILGENVGEGGPAMPPKSNILDDIVEVWHLQSPRVKPRDD